MLIQADFPKAFGISKKLPHLTYYLFREFVPRSTGKRKKPTLSEKAPLGYEDSARTAFPQKKTARRVLMNIRVERFYRISIFTGDRAAARRNLRIMRFAPADLYSN